MSDMKVRRPHMVVRSWCREYLTSNEVFLDIAAAAVTCGDERYGVEDDRPGCVCVWVLGPKGGVAQKTVVAKFVWVELLKTAKRAQTKVNQFFEKA